MPEVEYAEKELNELMRRYKENEANKELFFAEEREAAIKAQKEENARRQKLNDAERDAERASKEQKTIEDGAGGLTDAFKPVHPSEGAIRE
jgi:sRNA-binding protein